MPAAAIADVPSTRRLKRWLSGDKISALREHERARARADAGEQQGAADDLRDAPGAGALWERSTESSEQLLARLQDWCHRAEASGIAPLAQFSLQLKRYA